MGCREKTLYISTTYRCNGFEMRLTNCQHRSGNAAQSCGHQGDVGVECNVPDTSDCGEQSTALYNVRCELSNVRGNAMCIGLHALCMGGMLNINVK